MTTALSEFTTDPFYLDSFLFQKRRFLNRDSGFKWSHFLFSKDPLTKLDFRLQKETGGRVILHFRHTAASEGAVKRTSEYPVALDHTPAAMAEGPGLFARTSPAMASPASGVVAISTSRRDRNASPADCVRDSSTGGTSETTVRSIWSSSGRRRFCKAPRSRFSHVARRRRNASSKIGPMPPGRRSPSLPNDGTESRLV